MIPVLLPIPPMKARLFLPTIALLAMASAAVQAATVSVTVSSSGLGVPPKFVDSLGGFLTVGDAVRVGVFNTSTPANLATLQTSNVFADVNALFTALGENIANAGTVLQGDALGNPLTGTNLVINNGLTHNVFGQITNVDSNYYTQGTELFLWVFNNADPTLATQWGIFTSSGGWEFPSGLGSTTLGTNENVVILRGSSLSGNLALDNISVVPEPGSWLLLIVGAVALTGRRRRIGLQL